MQNLVANPYQIHRLALQLKIRSLRFAHFRQKSSPATNAQLLELWLSYGGGGVGKEQATVNIDATRKGVPRELHIDIIGRRVDIGREPRTRWT